MSEQLSKSNNTDQLEQPLNQQWHLLTSRSRIKTEIAELEDELIRTDHIIARYYPEIDLS